MKTISPSKRRNSHGQENQRNDPQSHPEGQSDHRPHPRHLLFPRRHGPAERRTGHGPLRDHRHGPVQPHLLTAAGQHPDAGAHHRAAGSRGHDGDPGGPDPQGRRRHLCHRQAAFRLHRPDHHQLHRDGTHRGFRPRQQAHPLAAGRSRQRCRLRPHPRHRRLLP